MTIRILDEDVANKIAAGEVIERPASVVKELIENAIDANGRRLLVEIRDAGMTYIRVSDDGEGIEAKQLPLAFLRHATSKITAASDLRSVRTLGFRGEALASIAAVARVEIYSRPQEQPTGAYLRIEGGQVLTHESAGCPVGTNIIVKDLFYNTPARRKFLKSPGAEKRYIIDVVGRLALANPHVAIRLVCDKEEVLSTQGNGDMLLAIQAVFGGELSGHYYYRDNGFCDSGMITFAQVVNLLIESGQPLHELIEPLRRYAHSGERSFHNEDKTGTIQRLADRYSDGEIDYLDGITVQYADWWFNVRPSNTEPFLRLNVEARDEEMLKGKLNELFPLMGTPA